MIRNIIITTLVFVCCACQQEEIQKTEAPLNPSAPGEYYTATFNLSGEWSSRTSQPESRANEVNDLYWTDIYYQPEESTSSSYPFYGYCVFDTPEAVNIKMLKGYKYNIFVSVVKNGKKLIWKDIQKEYYHYPIATRGEQTQCTNQFVRSSSNSNSISTGYGLCYLQGIQNSYTKTSHADLERYYGRIRDYVPDQSGQISIKLYRLYFGLKFIAENFPQEGGQILIEDLSAMEDPTLSFTLSAETPVIEWKAQWPYDIDKVPEAMENAQNVLSEHTFRVKWNSPDGTGIRTIAEQKIYVERNKMNIIRINLNPAGTKAATPIQVNTEPLE